MKVWYDKNAKNRTFTAGDQFLVLMPVLGHRLHAKYNGPYVIERAVGDLDYVVKTPDMRKKKQLCHINMLKMYHARPDVLKTVNIAIVVSENEQKKKDSDVSEMTGSTFRLKIIV